MSKIIPTVFMLRDWALKQKEFPRKTSFHAACVLYRGKMLMDPRTGKMIAATNSKEMCAERHLLKLCEKRFERKDKPSLSDIGDSYSQDKRDVAVTPMLAMRTRAVKIQISNHHVLNRQRPHSNH